MHHNLPGAVTAKATSPLKRKVVYVITLHTVNRLRLASPDSMEPSAAPTLWEALQHVSQHVWPIPVQLLARDCAAGSMPLTARQHAATMQGVG